MLNRQIIRTTKSNIRCYSTPIILFIPHENIYQFEGEKLTAEENEAAILPKPSYNSEKVYKDMLSPEYIADLVIRPQFNDVFCTALSNGSPFLGDKNYKIVPKDPLHDPHLVHLLFTDITTKYIHMFNKVPKPRTLPKSVLYPTLSKEVETAIEKEVHQFKPLDLDSLDIVGERLKVLESSARIARGDVEPTQIPQIVSVESICIYLLSRLPELEELETLAALQYIKSHKAHVTTGGSKRVTEKLIQMLRKGIEFPELFGEFLVQEIKDSLHDLQPTTLNDLVFVLAKLNRVNDSNNALRLLTKGFLPQAEVIEAYLNAYSEKKVTKFQFLRDNYILKPFIIWGDLTSPIARIIIEEGISTSIELDHFIQTLADKHIIVELADTIVCKYKEIEPDHKKLAPLIGFLVKQGLSIDKARSFV